jgi:hypothetical protein
MLNKIQFSFNNVAQHHALLSYPFYIHLNKVCVCEIRFAAHLRAQILFISRLPFILSMACTCAEAAMGALVQSMNGEQWTPHIIIIPIRYIFVEFP